MRPIQFATLLVIAAVSCSEHGPKPSTGRARVVNGATQLAAAAAVSFARGATATLNAGSFTEHWSISPDVVKATLTNIFFSPAMDSTLGSPLTGCEVTYDRSKQSLATLLECPFDLKQGTYTGMRLRYSSTYKVLVDDPVNGIYTDPAAPTGFSSTRPAGGAQLIDYVVVCTTQNCSPSEGNTFVNFSEPLVVGADPVELTVVMHGLHTIPMDRTNGVFAINFARNLAPIFLMPSVTNVAKVDFYSSFGSGATVNLQGGATTPPHIDFFIFHDSHGPTMFGMTNLIAAMGTPMDACLTSSTPTRKFVGVYVQNTSPSAADSSIPPANRPGGYLGRDAAGTIAWTMSTEGYGVSQHSLWIMPEVTTPGATATLKCLVTSNPPVPSSGDTYASGAPNIALPTSTLTMRLVAR